MTDFQVLFPGSLRTATCTECGSDFERKSTSRRTVCSEGCKRKRGLRHATDYHQNTRDMRQKILASFGGRMPTHAEILDLIKSRKAQSDDRGR